MVELQIINKIIDSSNIDILLNNDLELEHFHDYSPELSFILDHERKYGKVPDRESFLDEFNDFEFILVNEPDTYLVNNLKEEYQYSRLVPIIQEIAEMTKTDANEATEYIMQKALELIQTIGGSGVDIISKAKERYEEYLTRKDNPDWCISTGFKELDKIIYGWQRGEELVVLFARIAHGKSWILVTTLMYAWKDSFKAGLISPEMSATKIGYRFDTVNKNFSNSSLVRGLKQDGYKEYIEELTKNNINFTVATPNDFNRKVTVSKIRSFCIKNKLEILGIDGITYLYDERMQKGDNKTTRLSNISEDLKSLSDDLKIPIIIVVQTNRAGVQKDDDEGTPDLENIKDSDGIAASATKVISLRKKGPGIQFGIKKFRDGATADDLLYAWDIDTGTYQYIPSGVSDDDTLRAKVNKQEFKDEDNVF